MECNHQAVEPTSFTSSPSSSTDDEHEQLHQVRTRRSRRCLLSQTKHRLEQELTLAWPRWNAYEHHKPAWEMVTRHGRHKRRRKARRRKGKPCVRHEFQYPVWSPEGNEWSDVHTRWTHFVWLVPQRAPRKVPWNRLDLLDEQLQWSIIQLEQHKYAPGRPLYWRGVFALRRARTVTAAQSLWNLVFPEAYLIPAKKETLWVLNMGLYPSRRQGNGPWFYGSRKDHEQLSNATYDELRDVRLHPRISYKPLHRIAMGWNATFCHDDGVSDDDMSESEIEIQSERNGDAMNPDVGDEDDGDSGSETGSQDAITLHELQTRSENVHATDQTQSRDTTDTAAAPASTVPATSTAASTVPATSTPTTKANVPTPHLSSQTSDAGVASAPSSSSSTTTTTTTSTVASDGAVVASASTSLPSTPPTHSVFCALVETFRRSSSSSSSSSSSCTTTTETAQPKSTVPSGSAARALEKESGDTNEDGGEVKREQEGECGNSSSSEQSITNGADTTTVYLGLRDRWFIDSNDKPFIRIQPPVRWSKSHYQVWKELQASHKWCKVHVCDNPRYIVGTVIQLNPQYVVLQIPMRVWKQSYQRSSPRTRRKRSRSRNRAQKRSSQSSASSTSTSCSSARSPPSSRSRCTTGKRRRATYESDRVPTHTPSAPTTISRPHQRYSKRYEQQQHNRANGTRQFGIVTKYKDVFFASKLEARYAVFFDLLGVRWEYESSKTRIPWSKGKQGQTYCYTPDFYLPDLQAVIEVKPRPPGGLEFQKCKKASTLLPDMTVVLNYGEMKCGFMSNNRDRSFRNRNGNQGFAWKSGKWDATLMYWGIRREDDGSHPRLFVFVGTPDEYSSELEDPLLKQAFYRASTWVFE